MCRRFKSGSRHRTHLLGFLSVDALGSNVTVRVAGRPDTFGCVESELGDVKERLREARDQQRATSEILAAISRAPFEVDSTLRTILEQGTALCRADTGRVLQVDGPVLRERVQPTGSYQWVVTPWQPQTVEITRSTLIGKAVLEACTQHAPDVRLDAELRFKGPPLTRLAVPIKVAERVVGVLNFHRVEVAPFSPSEIALIETFADQAAIAIENVRLLTETNDALERQTAIGDVLEAMSSSAGNLADVFEAIVESAVRICGATNGGLFRIQGDTFQLAANAGTFLQEPLLDEGTFRDPLARPGRDSLTGRVLLERRTQRIDDIRTDSEYRIPPSKNASAIRSMVGVPIIRGDEILGVIVARRVEPRPFSPREVEILETFARQAAIAIENVRLFNETREKSAQLEVANQELAVASKNKSEFLANMSHELRTPLNAVIGFSDVLEQRMFGELSERQSEYVRDIATSGRQLLELVNEILDLSKVEAGRMELEPSEFAVNQMIRSALTFVRERASGHGIVLNDDSASDGGTIVADERKIRQVLLNLLSNAVKFTPDGGRVTVRAERRDTEMQVSVTDTGIGIAPEDQPRVFEEFRQVGTPSDRSHEGTGLGLALAKRFIELHGGRIWIQSEVGKGTIFTFAIPVERAAPAPA